MAIRTGHFLLAALLASGGCYTYRPVAVESLPAGSTVRARLSPAGSVEVAALTGEPTERIEGSFVRMSPDTLVLEIWRTDLRTERAFAPGRLQLPLQKRYVLDLTEKRLSYARTGAVTAALAVAAYQVYHLLAADAGGTSTAPPDPGGPVIIRCC